MANFGTDQVRQLYVVTSKGSVFNAQTPAGAIGVKKGLEDLFFNYQTPNGDNALPTTVRTDLIPKKNIEFVAATPAKKILTKKIDVSPNMDHTPIGGQTYLVRATFYGLGIGGNNCQYIKELGAYTAKKGDTIVKVMDGLNALILKNLAREPYPIIEYTYDTGVLKFNSIARPFVRGKKSGEPIDFSISILPVYDNGVEDTWATVSAPAVNPAKSLVNGRLVADMEWFYLGERGDTKRGYGYPNNFDAIYLADPTKEYDFIDIHYFYAGDAEDVQKSKKYITLAIAKDSTYTATALIADMKTAGFTFDVDKITAPAG